MFVPGLNSLLLNEIEYNSNAIEMVDPGLNCLLNMIKYRPNVIGMLSCPFKDN